MPLFLWPASSAYVDLTVPKEFFESGRFGIPHLAGGRIVGPILEDGYTRSPMRFGHMRRAGVLMMGYRGIQLALNRRFKVSEKAGLKYLLGIPFVFSHHQFLAH